MDIKSTLPLIERSPCDDEVSKGDPRVNAQVLARRTLERQKQVLLPLTPRSRNAMLQPLEARWP